ncbi:MAG: type II secretion system protein GspD [Gemmataceae bacterium]
MVARAQKRNWIDLVAGLLLGAAAQPLALLAGPDSGLALLPAPSPRGEQVVAQLGGGSRARLALNAAINAERLGDLDKAAELFQEARKRAADLTPEERRELDSRLAVNALALQARREAREQIGSAESALQEGRPAEAASLIKKITANEVYLSPADKQRFHALCQRNHTSAGAAPSAAANASTLAHEKIHKARAELTAANLDAAESLTQEAEELHAVFGPREDSPRKVRDDLDKARRDAKTMLQASRAALQRAEWDRAEKYARSADQLASPFTFMIGDSPAKVLKEIQTARGQTPENERPAEVGKETIVRAAGVEATNPPSDSDKARELVRLGREALSHGDLVQARKFADQASSLHAQLHWSEDNPARLVEDITRATGKGVAPVVGGNGAAPTTIIKTKEDALTQLKQGREQLAKGDVDEANKTAARLRAARHLHWGLFFEDTPDKFQADVDHARLQRNKQQSLEMLTEARRRFDKKDYAAAEKLAYEAQSKHGPYSIWDLGDRPSKVLADVQAARLRDRRIKLPEPPSPQRQEADLSRGPLAQQGANLAAQNNAASNNGVPQPPPPPASASVTPAAQTAATQRTANVPPTPNLPTLPGEQNPNASGGTLALQARARQLMAEARGLQRQNRLLEARDKIDEARRLGVAFRPDEESPNQIYQQLSFLARQRIDTLVHQAGDTLRYGTRAPMTRCQDAEADLSQARQLAVAFGLDVQPIENAKQMVEQLRNTGNITVVTAEKPQLKNQNSEQLLDQARLELRGGQTANARRFAEEAVKLGGGEVALTVLRSIDAEEAKQSFRRANRTFDEVAQAYQNRDYRRANLILASIDTTKLDERRQGRLREMLNTPEMQPSARNGGITLTGASAKRNEADSGSDAGQARATDDPGPSLIQRTRAMREIKFQQLRGDGITVQTQALERFRTGQSDVAVEMLQGYLDRLSEEQLDPGQMSMLRRPIDSRLQQFQLLKAQSDLANNRFDSRSRQVKSDIAKAKTAEQVKQQNVAQMMKQYNDLFQQAKYPEAEMVALRVKELDPDNPMASAAITMAKFHRNSDQYENDKARKEATFLEAMHGVDDIGDPDSVSNDITFSKDQKRLDVIRKRKSLEGFPMQRKSAEERNIERKLTVPVSLSHVNTPLRQIIEDLHGDYGINIFVDEPALAEKGIQLEAPVSIKLDNIALKSALKLLLNLAHLTYVVTDDVLKITTPEQARGKLELKVYPVADLVIAVENFGQVGGPPEANLGLVNVNQAMNPTMNPNAAPSGMNGMPGGMPVGMPAGSSMANAPPGGFAADPNSNVQVSKQRTQTHEDMLIKLITSTISPSSWSEQGGQGTIEFHPLTLGLAISQTPDLQDQVQDLLQALRRLIDQEVAVEVKFISISEDFFERIGVNFNMNIINKNRQALQYQPELTSGNFAAPGFINSFQPSNFISGLTPAGTLTSDLNIPITNSTYSQAVPPFGGYPGVPGYGGLTLGLAFLSDIQVFLFMEAVQGDIRSNVMQAPKLTLFNGQTANISVQDFQFFTIGVSVINGGFGQLVYNPITTLFPLNIILTIQAVISGDRRFVRLSLAPSLANVVNGEVNLFPVVTPIFPLFDGTATGQPVVFTQFIQQPHLTRVSVNTTVAVPDGGTVLMGGLKRLSEGRNEFGPPVISKIPYLSRLFRNIGYGRSAESLLIMVTPRIIIQAEEQEIQTGYREPASVAQ